MDARRWVRPRPHRLSHVGATGGSPVSPLGQIEAGNHVGGQLEALHASEPVGSEPVRAERAPGAPIVAPLRGPFAAARARNPRSGNYRITAYSHRVPRSPPLRKSATGVPSWMRASVTSDSSIALAIEGLAPHPKASASSLTESRGRGAAGRRCDGAPLILSGRTARPRLNNRHVASTALGLPSAGTFRCRAVCPYGTGCRCRTCGQGIMSSLLYR